MKAAIIISILSVSAISCGDEPTFSAVEVQGTFMLSTVNERPLPVMAACGGYQVAESLLTLGPHRTASYARKLIANGSGEQLTYESMGAYSVAGNIVRVTVSGRWSNSQQSYTDRFDFEIVDQPTLGIYVIPYSLARRHVGSECDASETEIYLRLERLE